MTQSKELESAKSRIRGLLSKTVSNGCTEAEALSAAEMVGKLLQIYALSIDEVILRKSACIQRTVPMGGVQRRPIDGCMPSLARFCDCKVWISREGEAAHYVFFGLEDDVALALYLHAIVSRGMAEEAAGYRRQQQGLTGPKLRQALRAYQSGMAARISERLDAMLLQRQEDVARQRSDGGALMVIKENIVEEAFKGASVRLVAGRSRHIPAGGAYRQGYQDGQNLNLNRPLRGGGMGRLSL